MSLDAGSNSVSKFKLFCEPCDYHGEHLEAFGYCNDCNEHLCTSCFKYYRRSTPSRNHILLDTENMPQEMTKKSIEHLPSDACSLHITSTVTHFCKSHHQLCCQICLDINHHMCKDVDYIPDVANDVVSTEEYKDFIKTLIDLSAKVDENQAKCKEHSVVSEILKKKAKAEIKQFAEDIGNFCKQLEREVYDETDKICLDFQKTFESLSGRLDKVKSELDRQKNIFEQLTEKKLLVKLFIALKRDKEAVISLEEGVKSVIEANIFPEYRFVSKAGMKLLMDCMKRTRIVYKGNAVPELSLVAEFPVKVRTDSNVGMITGSIMIDSDHLVLCDANNNNVILVDINRKTVLHEQPMECRDIALGQSGELVVTQPEKNRLSFLSKVDNRLLDTKKTLDVEGEPCAVVFCKEWFIITGKYPCGYCYGSSASSDECGNESYFIRCLEKTGDVIWEKNTMAAEIRFLGLSACNNFVFVSYSEIYFVETRNAQDGILVDTYRHDELERPSGITTDVFGNIFVCSTNNSAIHILDAKRNQICVFTDKTGCLSNPQTVAYCEQNDRLVVTMASSDKIAIFQLNWKMNKKLKQRDYLCQQKQAMFKETVGKKSTRNRSNSDIFFQS